MEHPASEGWMPVTWKSKPIDKPYTKERILALYAAGTEVIIRELLPHRVRLVYRQPRP